jgi:hypothetical protein
METAKKKIERWIDDWRRVAPILKQIKEDEIRNADYESQLPILDSMLQWAVDHASPRQSSGLVEQQRIFKKLRQKTRP